MRHFVADPERLLLYQKEAARRLNVTPHMVRRMIDCGQLETREVGSLMLVTKASVEVMRATLYGDAAATGQN